MLNCRCNNNTELRCNNNTEVGFNPVMRRPNIMASGCAEAGEAECSCRQQIRPVSAGGGGGGGA